MGFNYFVQLNVDELLSMLICYDYFLITLSSNNISCLITKYSIHFTGFNKSTSFRASSRKYYSKAKT